jgi:hypothetical protein
LDTDHYTLKAFNPTHGLHTLTLEVREVGDDYLISCKLPVTGELVTGQAGDCFAALQSVRRKAEGRNWMICCKGARRNVWPSGMSRQMGGGIKAYVLEMGRQGRSDLLVEIFDEDTPESYSTVADQEAYAHAWFESLR